MSDISQGLGGGVPGAGASGQFIRKVSLIIYGNPPTPGGTGLAVPGSAANGGIPTTDSDSGTAANGRPRVVITTPSSAPPTGNQPGIVLSDFRIQFNVTAMDLDAPPTATIRILNLSQSTASKIQKEFQSVVLQAGYENGNFGVIFQGTIIRVRKGRLSNIDTFVDIMASNLGALYTLGTVGLSVPANTSYKNQLSQVTSKVNSSPIAQGIAGAQQQGLQTGNIPDSFGTGGTLPRGKVYFGLWKEHLNTMTESTGSVWSIGPDGKINIHDLTGYNPGDAVVINAQTGMVGIPVATLQGIEVNCLLNPKIKCGTRIQLNNKDITTTSVNAQVGFPAYSDVDSGFIANTSTDGVYMALVVEHEGDTRDPGAAWITKIIALAVDASSGKVAAYG